LKPSPARRLRGAKSASPVQHSKALGDHNDLLPTPSWRTYEAKPENAVYGLVCHNVQGECSGIGTFVLCRKNHSMLDVGGWIAEYSYLVGELEFEALDPIQAFGYPHLAVISKTIIENLAIMLACIVHHLPSAFCCE